MSKKPILYKGEMYSRPIEKRTPGREKKPIRTYKEAQEKILSDISKTKSFVSALSQEKRLPNEFVICVKLSPEFSAKSYYPESIFDSLGENNQAEEIGSRTWNLDNRPGKLFFVRTTDTGLDQLETKLKHEEDDVTKKFAYDIKKIESIGTLDSEDQILGISDDWTEGCLEAVLHPFEKDSDAVLNNFLGILENSGTDLNKVRYKQYESGITFVSLYGNKNTLESISGYNPLRTVHPLELRDLPVSRGGVISGGPLPSDAEKPDVTVGVFDGGLKPNNPYLSKFAEGIDLIGSTPNADYLDHGTQVTGAVIYGAINPFSSNDTLPAPKVSVKSFRVLPPTDAYESELYEIIDLIEDTVPKYPEIKVFNLSFGPIGPILDDYISRFTFACDRLSMQHNVLFTVAVGNDGRKPKGLSRIQSPSDMANGLAIGAYTKDNGKIIRAPYSCIGPGREGNKLKPDLVAFGGCDQHPIHLIADELDKKIWDQGTSFASPIVAGYAGQLIGYSNDAIDPLVARGLLIHSAVSKKKGHCGELGHGSLAETVEDIISCEENSYTLIYKGELIPGKYAEFTIPWDPILSDGKVKFKWTLAVATATDPHSPDDYTSSSVMMSLYPHKNKYMFKKEGERDKIIDIEIEKDLANNLTEDGWRQLPFPITNPTTPPYSTEEELRSDMKWDSIDARSIKKEAKDIFQPFFHVHAFERGKRYKNKKIRFAVILTLESTVPDIDLYSKIIQKYPALVPINININSVIQVNAS